MASPPDEPRPHAGTSAQNVDYNSTVASAAQSLINVLTQNLAQGQEHGSHPEQGRSSVEQDMTRSFPGFFTRKSFLGKRKFPSSKISGSSTTKTWRPFSFYAYLLNLNSETTPNSAQELELAQAGLGKRNLNMSKDMSHEEFFGLLKFVYPKMQMLTGGWLLYKATGGQGKRKLIMIPPDYDGYTATLIRNVTAAGKTNIYIVPLQYEFSLNPLPPDAVEFLNMPKAQCQTCKFNFPIQILSQHVKECVDLEMAAMDIEACQSEVQIVSVTSPSPVHCDTQTTVEEKVACPICFSKFSPQFLEIHASVCGEREAEDHMMAENETVMSLDSGEEQMKS